MEQTDYCIDDSHSLIYKLKSVTKPLGSSSPFFFLFLFFLFFLYSVCSTLLDSVV